MSEQSVLKFGGTSAANPERIADIFTADPNRNRVAVISAIGKDVGDRSGQKMTDVLLDLEAAAAADNPALISEAQDKVIARTRETYSSLGSASLARATDYIHDLLDPGKADGGYAWIGEHISAKLFAELTGAVYVPTDLRFAGGVLQLRDSINQINRRLIPSLKAKQQLVTEGFFGFDTRSGRVETLPRGGSDISAVIYAGALGRAQPGLWINENFTDRDGILSADPSVVTSPVTIPEMTHEEVREKMHGVTEKNGVVHGDAIAYAYWLDVEMAIRNSFNSDVGGTRIVHGRESDPRRPIIGISGKSDQVALDVFDMGMADAKNYLLAIFEKTGKLDVSISNVPTGEDRLKLVFNSGIADEDLGDISRFILDNAISNGKATVEVRKDEGAVYLIGQELTDPLTYTRILGRVAGVLDVAGKAIREVISHEKSPSLALTVDGSDVDEIVQALHKEFIES